MPFVDTKLSDWDRVLATNLTGVFLGTKHALKAMHAGGGCILNVASAAGLKPLAGNAAYGTSKAAVRFLTRVAAIQGDANGNGVSEPGEVTPVEVLGITSLSCTGKQDASGSYWNPAGVTFKDGTTRPTYDWVAPCWAGE